MRAGRLDRSISIERASRAVSPAGTVSDNWATIATVRAELVRGNALEAARAFGEAETSTVLFRVRYLADITTADRVMFDGETFDLVEIEEIGRRRGLNLRCERIRQ